MLERFENALQKSILNERNEKFISIEIVSLLANQFVYIYIVQLAIDHLKFSSSAMIQ